MSKIRGTVTNTPTGPLDEPKRVCDLPAGDRGQRFEIRYQEGGKTKVFGWAGNPLGAREMARTWYQRPSITAVAAVDRENGDAVIYVMNKDGRLVDDWVKVKNV